MNRPPMMVSGTTDTIPARMADMYVFSLSAVSAGTTYLFRNPLACSTVPVLSEIARTHHNSIQ